MAKAKQITVKVLKTVGQSSLVEAEVGGRMLRCYLPAEAAAAGTLEVSELEAGVPYGLPWEELIKLGATPQGLADRLRRAGIWTYADLTHNVPAALNAIQTSYRFDLAALLTAANAYEHSKED